MHAMGRQKAAVHGWLSGFFTGAGLVLAHFGWAIRIRGIPQERADAESAWLLVFFGGLIVLAGGLIALGFLIRDLRAAT